MSVGTFFQVLSLLLSIVKWMIEKAEQKKWMDAGRREAVLQGLEECNEVITKAQEVRDAVRAEHERDPSSIMRDDEFTRRD